MIVPVRNLSGAKTRLSSALDQRQRAELSLKMLEGVLNAASSSALFECRLVVSPDRSLEGLARSLGFELIPEERNDGVNAAVARGSKVLGKRGMEVSVIIPSDLPILGAEDLRMLVGLAPAGRGCVISPSLRLDGTNGLLMKPIDVITTFYDQNSFPRHVSEARRTGVELRILVSRGFCMDIDTPEDIRLLLDSGVTAPSREYLLGLSAKPEGLR